MLAVSNALEGGSGQLAWSSASHRLHKSRRPAWRSFCNTISPTDQLESKTVT